MKLKAAATATMPNDFLEALDSQEVDEAFQQAIIINLRVNPADIGPATHFVQLTDLTIPRKSGQWGIEVTMSKVSSNWRRSGEAFVKTLEAIQQIYVGVIEQHLFDDQEVQLFVVLQVDEKIQLENGEWKNLPELAPILVRGGKPRPTEEMFLPDEVRNRLSENR